MTLDGRATQFTTDALAKVDAFIAERPGYTRRGVAQPGQGATNRVVFARRGDELVVFRVFCQVERKERECFALHHWQATGLVPELLVDVDSIIIVMSYIPGVYLGQARQVDGEAAWREVCRETGRAICRYLSYDGTPGTGYDWASPADPVRYRQSIKAIERMLEVKPGTE